MFLMPILPSLPLLVVTGLLAGPPAPVSPVAALHPGSGIVVDDRGNVYFVDTGGGVYRIDQAGRLTRHPGQAFHWMALDRSGRLRGHPLGRIAAGTVVVSGDDPGLVLSSDGPVATGPDGTLYAPRLDRDGRLRIHRMAPDGQTAVHATLPTATAHGEPLRWLHGLAAGPDGALYGTEATAVHRIAPNGTTSILARVSLRDCRRVPGDEEVPLPNLRGLDVGADGAVYVAASGCGQLLRITPAGEVTTLLRAEHPWAPTGVAVAGRDLYVLEYFHTPGDDRREWLPRVRRRGSDGSVATVAQIRSR